MIGIYKITSPSGSAYIGQSIDVENRFSYYKHLCCKKQPRLYNSLMKYGVENHTFEVLITLSEDEDVVTTLNTLEAELILKLNTLSPNGLNLQTGGGNHKCSNETKDKMSKFHTGKKITESHRQAFIASNKRRALPVCQYDKQGNYIASYRSIKEAASLTGCVDNCITAVCKGYRGAKSSKGFIWKYKNISV